MLCAQCRRLSLTAARQTRIAAPPQICRFAPLSATLQAKAWRNLHTRDITILARGSAAYSTSPLSAAAAAAAAASAVTSSPTSTSSPAGPEKPDYLDPSESDIWDKLVAEFSPTELMVQDISGGCGSMYGIEISSEKFRGVNLLKQQRMVNTVLGEQMKGWHGVQLRTKVPS